MSRSTPNTTRLAHASVLALMLSGAAMQPLAAQQRTPETREPTVDPVDAMPAQGTIAAPKPGPQQDGDPGGPGQGRQAQFAPVGAVDLLLVDAFQLGNSAIPWGTAATVPASDAVQFKRGRCVFRYKFTTRNDGAAGAGAFTNRIHRDAVAGPVLATDPVTGLMAGAMVNSDGHLLLAPGTAMLYVAVDDGATVAETNEANNLRRVRVTVKGDCR